MAYKRITAAEAAAMIRNGENLGLRRPNTLPDASLR